MYSLFLDLTQSVNTEEQIADRNKRHRKNPYPHKNAGNTLRIKVYKEVGIDERRSCRRDQNGSIKLQDDCLNRKECDIRNRERDGSDGIIPPALFAFI